MEGWAYLPSNNYPRVKGVPYGRSSSNAIIDHSVLNNTTGDISLARVAAAEL
jgi:hypothetical protein